MQNFIHGCIICRQYIYGEREKQFTSLSSFTFHDKCVLCVSHFFHNSKPDCSPHTLQAFLCSTATDGQVSIWNLNGILHRWMLYHSSLPTQVGVDKLAEPVCVIRAHQSGINAISVHTVGELQVFNYMNCVMNFPLPEDGRSHLIASVGDDNALTVSEVAIVSSEGSLVINLITKCSVRSAHSSSITGNTSTLSGICIS